MPGSSYVVSEIKAPDNYQADPTPQTVVVNAGDTQTLRFYDDPLDRKSTRLNSIT